MSVEIEAELVERARRVAAERGVAVPQLVREALEHEMEPEGAAEMVALPEAWKTFEDGTPQPDWTALIREDRDRGH